MKTRTTFTKLLAMMIVSAILISCFGLTCFAKSENYPCVFVPGMVGWGAEDEMYASSPYWGMTTDEGDLMKSLESKGYECYAASVGPLSSAWDRACELYAQLTGTVVDYGEAHSAAHHHNRYGRSYEGKALMDGFGTGKKINLFGHSFGGATIRTFTYVLANGSAEEMAATGEKTSEFFKGGKGDLVNSVTTLSAPHNGSPIANLMYDIRLPICLIAMFVNLNDKLNVFPLDFKLTQFSLTDSNNFFATLCGISAFAMSNDNCGYDLTLRGAREVNESIGTVDGVYYFSFSTCGTKPVLGGRFQSPTDLIGKTNGATSWIIGHMTGLTVDGVKLKGLWQPNDGVVPVISAQYPTNENHIFVDGAVDKFDDAVWYVMPTIDGDHSTYMGVKFDGYLDFYCNHIDMLNSL